MENELSWLDKIIIPKTQAYKNFIKEMEDTPSEQWMMDGERRFTEKEEKFLKIYDYKNGIKEVPVLEVSVKGKQNQFSDIQKGIAFFEKQNINEKSKVNIKNNLIGVRMSVKNNAEKYKIISDFYALELTQPTRLSDNITKTQTDEKQAHYYRQYETEAKKLGIESTPFIETGEQKADIQNKDSGLNPQKSIIDEYGLKSLSAKEESELENLHQQINQAEKPVGKITFHESGEVMEYTSIDTYLNALEREFDSNIGAFKYETLLRNPELLKKVDDLIYSIHGEENPNSLDSYVKKVEKDKDIEAEVLQNPVNDAIKQITEKIRALHRERNYELLADNFSAAKEIELKINELEKHINNLNQNPNSMETQKEFDQTQYLKAQLRYLGFGEDEKLHKDLEKGINSKKQQFEIKTTSDKTLPGNKIDYTLNYNKTEKGGIFLNSYDANLTNEKGESVSQNFRVSKDNSYTAKEAINLLEGRSVKIEFDNPKSNEREPAYVKLNFGEEKNQWGNYNFQVFYKKYGVNAADIVEKSNLVFDKPEFKADTIKSLEKGNVVKVKFEIEDKVIEGKAVLNPQNRNLNLYDNDMTRINTNEPIKDLEADNNQEKNNVKEQSKSRGI